jgi:hypothetical protein
MWSRCGFADSEISLTIYHHHIGQRAAGITGNYLYLFFPDHIASLQVTLKLGILAYPIHATVSMGSHLHVDVLCWLYTI